MPLILGTNSIKDTGYDVANSCRFNDGDSAYMHKTPGSAGNRRTFTFSCWIKRGALGHQTFFSAYNADDATRPDGMRFAADNRLYVNFRNTEDAIVSTARLFRDVTAWYHICVAVDTTQGTAANRVKIYVNGTQETVLTGDGAGDSASYMDEDFECGGFNRDNKHQIGSRAIDTPTLYFDGYMAEAVFIDGTAYGPTSFGEFNSDSPTIWQPIDVSGLTFGTNGFYLDFEASGNLGNDANGGTDLTEVNLAAVDQCVDSPTNNFAVYNAALGLGGTLAEANCEYQTADSYDNSNTAFSTIGVQNGKWYAEFLVTATSSGNSVIGAGYDPEAQQDGRSNFCQEIDEGWGYAENGNAYNNGATDLGTTYTTDDIVGVALDLDGNKIYWYKNNTLINSGGTAIDADELYFFGVSDTTAGGQTTVQANFGNPPTALSSAANDENGYGNFEFAPPSGFLALCTKNLAEEG